MPTVPVQLADAAYDIHVEPGLLARAGEQIRLLSRSRRVMVLTDQTVAPLYLPALQQSLQASGFEVISAVIPGGEDHKDLPTLLQVFDTFLQARIERSTPIIALGGGIVGDMAGFVAASILRGVPLVQIPTTLLAMVDSSVGGKTGVNHAMGKNLIGAFHQPVLVLADPLLLQTLPAAELISGLAECIKHEIIRDADGFESLEHNLPAILQRHTESLSQLIAHNVAIKAAVVKADPFERGDRAHLNFGHTFGHAFERVFDYRLSHGQCVALGMVAASRLAVSLGILPADEAGRIIRLLDRADLPVRLKEVDAPAVHAAMTFDKKVMAGRLRFILPGRIGHVVIRDDVPSELVLQTIQNLRQ